MIIRVQVEPIGRHQLLPVLPLLLLLRVVVDDGVLVAERVERDLVAARCYQVIILRYYKHSGDRAWIRRHRPNYLS